MKRFNKSIRTILLSAVLAALVAACVSFPEEYVPPEKIVFLRQPFYLVPVRYAPESADPYSWAVDPEIDPVHPGILTSIDFNTFLKPDLGFDAKTYKETREHLVLMKDDALYNKLKARLDALSVEPPVPRILSKGEQSEKYSNGTGYAYPEEAGATIVYLTNNDIKIMFQDGRNYFCKQNGDYFETDEKGSELYAFFAKDGSFRKTLEDGVFYRFPNQQSLKTEKGEIMKTDVPEPQYAFTPAGKKYKYVYFVKDFADENLTNIALIHDNQIRYDYFPDNQGVMVTAREKESVVITKEFNKSHHYFNQKTRKAEDIYSYYFPEGIRITDLQTPLARAEVNPNWPERYLERKIGPYRVFYVKKDEALLARFDIKKLNETYAIVSQTTGIKFSQNRAVILSPDLASYRKLHAQGGKETLSWYPSGFQGKDIVVMWPPSLPRYEGAEGADYFWETELYEILTHELVHLAVGEVTGIFPPVPVWLNEGLAVYVESRYSPEAKKYWDVTFDACRSLGKLLPWDEIALNSTSHYPVDAARTEYAQSYKMVGYLMEKYGMKNLYAYLVSFKLPFDKIEASDVKASYKDNFNRIFKITWEENAAGFEKYCQSVKP